MIFSQTITTTILHNINGLFHQYLNIDFIRKNFTDKIINSNWLSKNISSMVFYQLFHQQYHHQWIYKQKKHAKQKKKYQHYFVGNSISEYDILYWTLIQSSKFARLGPKLGHLINKLDHLIFNLFLYNHMDSRRLGAQT